MKVKSAPGRFSALMPPGSSEASEAIQATEGAMTYRIAYVDVDATEARSPKALLDAARKQVVASSAGKLLGRGGSRSSTTPAAS